jgi:branched-chain amino acid transport system permease protein
MAVIRTKPQWVAFILFLAFMVIFPMISSGYVVSLMNRIAIYIVVVQGLNLLTGYTGQISVAQSAFMAVGAFTTGILSTKLGLNLWLCLPFAGVAAGLVGVFFGVPSFRVKGLYLALVSIGAQFIIMYVLLHWKSLTGGVHGIFIEPLTLGPVDFIRDKQFYYVAFGTAALVTALTKNIIRTRAGRAFVAVRDNDIVAEFMGVNLYLYKVLAFFVGCFFAGIGGWLWSCYLGAASVDHYSLIDSIWFLAMVVIGGMGSVLGTILGVFFVEILREFTNILGPMISDAVPSLGMNVPTALPLLTLGAVIVIFLVFEPRGLAHRWEIVKNLYRLWPYSR